MAFETVVRRRRRVCTCTGEPVGLAATARILDLAHQAPSGLHLGADVAGGCGRWISKAPVLIVPRTGEAAYHGRCQERDRQLGDRASIGHSSADTRTS